MVPDKKRREAMPVAACDEYGREGFVPGDDFQKEVKKASLLLHSCCGPCSTAVVERLADEFDVTVFFYNPCITDEEEYQRRRSAQIQFIEKFNEENMGRCRISFKEGDYRPGSFIEMVKGHEEDPEGGARSGSSSMRTGSTKSRRTRS